MNTLTDEALMRSYCAGDHSAFDGLFTRYSAAIHRLMARNTRDDAAADDLTQATFLSVVRGRGQFASGSRFRPWLYAIAINALRGLHRRSGREVVTEHGDLPQEELEHPALPDPPLQRRLTEAIERLAPNQRTALLLHQVDGLAFAEIAVRCRTTEAAVKLRAHRGSERLRRELADL